MTRLFAVHTPCRTVGQAVCGLKDVEADVEEEIQVHCVESLVEGNRFQMEKHFDNFGAADPHVACLFDQFVLVRGKINPQIFKIFF